MAKQMIKRKDGSVSQRGLWDNIRANKGSGKKPTAEMLKQERKIKAKMETGGDSSKVNNQYVVAVDLPKSKNKVSPPRFAPGYSGQNPSNFAPRPGYMPLQPNYDRRKAWEETEKRETNSKNKKPSSLEDKFFKKGGTLKKVKKK